MRIDKESNKNQKEESKQKSNTTLFQPTQKDFFCKTVSIVILLFEKMKRFRKITVKIDPYQGK